ncbi:Uncharacterised protein [Acinetobacter baumannii]|nr:Uncharacterised protein [Acinetobacter baumannii]
MLLRFGLGAPQIDRLAPQPAALDAGRQQAALLFRTTQQANGSDLQMMQGQAPCQLEFLLGQVADASEDFPPVPLHAGEHARHCQRQQSTVAQACRPTGHGSRCPGVGRVEPGFAHAAPRTGSEGQALARGKQAPVMERDGMSCL